MKKKVSFLLTLFLSLCILSSCGGTSISEQDGGALAIILGRHANANMYSAEDFSDMEMFQELLNASASITDKGNGEYSAKFDVSVIVNDGKPETVRLPSELKNEFSAYNQAFVDGYNKMLTDINKILVDDSFKADDEEVDLLAALAEARAVLENSMQDRKMIVIIDSGISTSGYFNMTEIDIQNGTVEEIADKAIYQGAFPDLTGYEVVFIGLGNVSEQQPFDRSDTELTGRLEEIWEYILTTKCGAKLVSSVRLAVSEGEPMMYDEGGDGYPYVSPVMFEKSVSISLDEGFSLSSQLVRFRPDTADFVNPNKAISTIKGCSEGFKVYVESSPSNYLYVVGSAAWTSKYGDLKHDPVALKRANKIANVLNTDCGIPSDRIKVIDAGNTEFSWRNFEKAELNRLVRIIPNSATSEVNELRDKGYID